MTSLTTLNELAGPVLHPEDADYDRARSGFQTAYRHEPSVIVAATSADDVRAAVRYAAGAGLSIAVQASGHGLAAATEGGVLVDTTAMAQVRVDPATRTAWVAAGTRWGQVVKEAARHGLAPLSGSSPGVGVVGYTLGGGLGVLGREYGYAADHVRAVELVTADGSPRRVTPASDPELFWALRGAGGNFGVVTALEVGLVPVTRLYGGGLYFDTALVPDVLAAYREWTATVPDGLTSSVGLIPYPDLPMLPEPLRGRYVAHVRIAYTGSVAEGSRLVAPLRAVGPRLLDTLGELPYTESPSIYRDPEMPHAYYGTNAMLRELAEPVAPAILDLVGPDSPVPCVVQLNHLGGALSRPRSVPNAVAHRDAAYLVRVLAVLDDPGPSPARSAPTRLTDALREWTLGRSPNFVFGERVFGERVFGTEQGEAERSGAERSGAEWSGAERSGAELVRDCYSAADLPRLAELKVAVDPANLFRCNLNIPPATRRSPRPGTPPTGRA